jgi:hypothetical protein
MKTYRKTSIIVGILFIVGTLAGFIGAFVVLGPILGEPVDLGKIAAQGSQLSLGALLILVMGLALAMVPALMFPIFKKYNEPLALGYLVFRGALESMAYIASVVGFLALGTLGKEFVKAGAPALSHFQTLGSLLLAGNDWISAMTSIVFSLSALMFNGLMFSSRLIPRWLSVWGFAGAVLYLAEPLLFMFGFKWEFLFAPLALQEMVMAVWLIAKGFNRQALASSTVMQV